MNKLRLIPAVTCENQPEDMTILEVAEGEFKGVVFAVGKFKFPFLGKFFPTVFKPSYDMLIYADKLGKINTDAAKRKFLYDLEFTIFVPEEN